MKAFCARPLCTTGLSCCGDPLESGNSRQSQKKLNREKESSHPKAKCVELEKGRQLRAKFNYFRYHCSTMLFREWWKCVVVHVLNMTGGACYFVTHGLQNGTYECSEFIQSDCAVPEMKQRIQLENKI